MFRPCSARQDVANLRGEHYLTTVKVVAVLPEAQERVPAAVIIHGPLEVDNVACSPVMTLLYVAHVPES